jgi:hypothetical protein
VLQSALPIKIIDERTSSLHWIEYYDVHNMGL